MNLKNIADFIESEIPQKLALDSDNVGFNGEYDLNQKIYSIKIFMDLYREHDDFPNGTLIITHHPPLFKPKTPTYTIHSNWDIIDGGANEALADVLDLNVVSYFDDETNIGRICECNSSFKDLKEVILDNFESARVVNEPESEAFVNTVGIISGFGLKNPDYIRLAKNKNLKVLISGDLTQETAVLAKNLDVTLIDVGHHESEIAGLYRLCEIFDGIDAECEVIDISPIQKL